MQKGILVVEAELASIPHVLILNDCGPARGLTIVLLIGHADQVLECDREVGAAAHGQNIALVC